MLKRSVTPILSAFAAWSGWAQTPAPPATPAPAAAEVASHETNVTFQSKVTLVLVPVVVRDRAGKPVGNLKQEDFQLFDKGKLQTIAKFSVEKSTGKAIPLAPAVEHSPDEKGSNPEALSIIAPDHFVAYLFDDIHLDFANLVQARDAAEKHLATTLKETDRAAIYTTSGQTMLDFTDDRAKIHETLAALRIHPIARTSMQECPDLSFYMSNLIQNRHDPIALRAAEQETVVCMNLQTLAQAETYVDSAAQRVISAGTHETRVTMSTLKDLVRRMAGMPGERLIVLVSPGFLRLDEHFQDETDIIDRAIKNNVTISALDARGLYTDTPDISKRAISLDAERVKQQYDRESSRAEADIMAEFADGTGGTFFQNSNDLGAGFRELAAVPEVYYVIGFSPQNLKLDGGYHSLKVSVKSPPGLSVKARRGYYAPRHLSDADENAKEEISQALFSREEMRDIPIELHTQFFKASETDARLVVMTRLDVRKLHFRKEDGRNDDEVMIVSGLFDRNGNYLQGSSKKVEMKLKDDTLQNKLNSGLTVWSDFKVTPGTYVIRLVVRDAEGQMMATQNGAVEIP
ncbi:MAG: VWA domain-containing protein [Acidobacteriota bacterium]|nr:VWA domain-containing protein [Acidobacteriota bacterium]